MQPRIRSVKQEVFSHELLWHTEHVTGLPTIRAFIALWTMTDRRGLFEWKPGTLKTYCTPFDALDFEDVLNVLANADFIVRYTDDNGRVYGWIPRFLVHQSINNRELDSRLQLPSRTVIEAHERRAIKAGFSMPTREELLSLAPDLAERVGMTRENGQKPIVPTTPSNDNDLRTRGGRVHDATQGEQNRTELNRTELDITLLSTPNGADASAGSAIVKASETPLPALVDRNAKALGERIAAVMAEVQTGTRSRLTREQVRRLQAETVFSYWVHKTGRDVARTKIDDKRERYISARLAENGGDVSELLYAVDGAVKDPHLQGHNDRNKRYDYIALIFRDREHVEELASLCKGYKAGDPHPLAVKYAGIARDTHATGGQ